MPIRTAWANADRSIITITPHDSWTWADLSSAIGDAAEKIKSVDHLVHVVCVNQNDGENGTPDGALSQLHRFASARPPENLGMIILVGFAGSIERGAEIFSRVYRPVVQVSSREEADSLIAQYAFPDAR
jgi:hypothetical protein